MAETATTLDPGFSVADATLPDFTLREGELLVEFSDWREVPIRVRFTNTAGVKWEELHSAGPEDRDDAVFEIVGSRWLEECVAQRVRTAEEGLRHFRLCFNPHGVLDVLAASMESIGSA